MFRFLLFLGAWMGMFPSLTFSQNNPVFSVVELPAEKKVIIKVDNQVFTQLLYADTLTKPLLFPVHASDGLPVTRGFPIDPRQDDAIDRPQEAGMWMAYEKVNGIDFWNSTSAVSPEKKHLYGRIQLRQILSVSGGEKGVVEYLADWTHPAGQLLLQEKTRLEFYQEKNIRWIDWQVELTAATQISMPDAKDGLLGIRVAHELELPVNEITESRDGNGNFTRIARIRDHTVTGDYLTSAGKKGEAAWGSRGNWCMLYGRRAGVPVSITLIDHSSNLGYPTFWNAHSYGLLAANPFGQKIFSKGETNLNYKMIRGKSIRLRYRTVITAGLPLPFTPGIEKWVKTFEEKQ